MATQNGKAEGNVAEAALKELQTDRDSPVGRRTPNKSTTLIITGVHRVSKEADEEAAISGSPV